MDTELPVLSYVLMIDDGFGSGVYRQLKTGIFPNLRMYTVSNLTTGLRYGFRLKAVNFNGDGE
jgi:hypothetical protein